MKRRLVRDLLLEKLCGMGELGPMRDVRESILRRKRWPSEVDRIATDLSVPGWERALRIFREVCAHPRERLTRQSGKAIRRCLVGKYRSRDVFERAAERARRRGEFFPRTRNATRNRAMLRALLRSGRPIRLEVGAGPGRELPGWTTVDIAEGCDLQLDITQKMPFPDNSVSSIYSSHVLEHFSYPIPMLNILRECRRILKPGGCFSAAVPNARLYVEGYLRKDSWNVHDLCHHSPALHYLTSIDVLNYMAYMDGDHKHLFDEENLCAVLKSADFRNVRLRELDAELDLAVRDYESIYAECEKQDIPSRSAGQP